jgi:hypothetical protein
VETHQHDSQGRLGPARSADLEEYRRKSAPAREPLQQPEGATTEILRKRIDTTKLHNAWQQ